MTLWEQDLTVNVSIRTGPPPGWGAPAHLIIPLSLCPSADEGTRIEVSVFRFGSHGTAEAGTVLSLPRGAEMLSK